MVLGSLKTDNKKGMYYHSPFFIEMKVLYDKKYIILSSFCFFTFIIFSIFLGTNCLEVVSRYLKGGNEYLEIWKDACIAYGQECSNVNNFFNLMKSYFNSLPYDFAYYIDHGTMAFSYLLPIITVISGIYFRKYIETLFPLKAYRQKNY